MAIAIVTALCHVLVTYVYSYSTCSYTYKKTARMDSISRPSSESAEIRANRLLRRRERETESSLCFRVSRTKGRKTEKAKNKRQGQAGY